MILATLLIISFGYFLLYNTSKKVKLGNSTFEKWMQSHVVISKSVGVSLLFTAMFWFVYEFGIGMIYYTYDCN